MGALRFMIHGYNRAGAAGIKHVVTPAKPGKRKQRRDAAKQKNRSK